MPMFQMKKIKMTNGAFAIERGIPEFVRACLQFWFPNLSLLVIPREKGGRKTTIAMVLPHAQNCRIDTSNLF